ncbi:MAG: alginate export family protein, partial [Acidobacteriota bacterium]|nr:alginate export family protein [Acidobacteriota bacterium]
RLETVDIDGFEEEALAPTFRTRLGYQTAPYRNWHLLVDFEDIYVISDDDYNDTKNGNVAYPVVADTDDTELNQAYLAYKPNKNRALHLGRQRLVLDNARFIGNVGWRQNEQTFDGMVWRESFTEKSTMTLAYIANVNRVFGENHPNPLLSDFRTSTILANYKLSKMPFGNLTLFGYFIDLDDLPSASQRSLGVRLDGKHKAGDMTWLYELSYANQADHADGSDVIDADYMRVTIGPQWANYTITLNYEVLGGDGDYGFSTPLAPRHGFNGWADIFLNTPDTGLVDLFLQFNYVRDKWKMIAAWHHFESDEGSLDYGTELDLLVGYQFDKNWDLGLKYADYAEDGYRSDTTKFWLWLHFKL